MSAERTNPFNSGANITANGTKRRYGATVSVDLTEQGTLTGIGFGGPAMKKLLLGSVALAAMIAGPAMAADMPMKAPPPPVLLYDWSGLYVGASIGGMWYDINRTFPNVPGIAPPVGLGLGALTNPINYGTSGSDAIFDLHAGFQGQ